MRRILADQGEDDDPAPPVPRRSDSFTPGKRQKVFRGYYFVALFWKREISTNDFVGRLRVGDWHRSLHAARVDVLLEMLALLSAS